MQADDMTLIIKTITVIQCYFLVFFFQAVDKLSLCSFNSSLRLHVLLLLLFLQNKVSFSVFPLNVIVWILYI